jgi:hypothetical protein
MTIWYYDEELRKSAVSSAIQAQTSSLAGTSKSNTSLIPLLLVPQHLHTSITSTTARIECVIARIPVLLVPQHLHTGIASTAAPTYRYY